MPIGAPSLRSFNPASVVTPIAGDPSFAISAWFTSK